MKFWNHGPEMKWVGSRGFCCCWRWRAGRGRGRC